MIGAHQVITDQNNHSPMKRMIILLSQIVEIQDQKRKTSLNQKPLKKCVLPLLRVVMRTTANAQSVRIAVVVLAPITANTRSVLAKETLRNDGMPIIAENATFVLIAQIVRKARAVRIVQIVRITQIAREALVVQIVQVVHKVQIA